MSSPFVLSIVGALALSGLSLAAQSATIDSTWRIVVGSAPLEKTAGEDLARELKEDFGLVLPVSNASDSITGPAIVIGTIADNPLIAAETARASFDLTGSDPERYHLATRGDRLYAAGATPKGAMNAAFRFADRRTLGTDGIDEARSPVFRYRVAGHLMNQRNPDSWTEEDQARYYARHYINVVWGEKHLPPLSLAVRQKYGLGLMAELRFPFSATEEWWSDPANADGGYYLKKGAPRRVISPFSVAGRRWYLDGHRKLLEANPDIRIMYAIFGDYNVIPNPDSVRISDGERYGYTRAQTMAEILKIMREAVGERDIVPRAWMWHGFYGQHKEREAFMQELPKLGFGPMYNEAGDDDCWVIKLDNFDDAALRTGPDGKSLYGPDYLSLASIGGACESVNPVIGMPLPRIAAYKLGRLAQVGVRDVALWWGSGEGWVYQPNLEVLASLTWAEDTASYGISQDFAAVEPLLRSVAERDFGKALAPEVVEYWRRYDDALITNHPRYKQASTDALGDPTEDGLRIYDWYQRMGVYGKWVFGESLTRPLTPTVLSQTKYGKWGTNDYALANYAAVLENLGHAQDYLNALISKAGDSKAQKRLQSMSDWTELYRLLLTSQYQLLKGLTIVRNHQSEPPDSAKLRAALEPLVRESIANTGAIIDLAARFGPKFNITQAHRNVVYDQCDWSKEVHKFESKIDAMKIWLEDLQNLALNRPVEASSFHTEKPDRKPQSAVDGNPETLWSSKSTDSEWIQVDLGKPHRLDFAVLDWKTAFAEVFEVQVAPGDQPWGWETVYRCENGRDGTMRIRLPKNTAARFVRIQGIKRGTPFGYGLREIQLYGE